MLDFLDNDNYFTRSPFSQMAAVQSAGCWAGRKDVLNHLHRLIKSYVRRADSTLDIVWANLGAGKTHTLYHLAHILKNLPENHKAIPVFVELPQQIKKFIDLYPRIVKALPRDQIAPALCGVDFEPYVGILGQAGRVLLDGAFDQKNLAWDWLTGGRPHLNDLKKIGITRRIEDDVTATDVMCGIVFALAAKNIRLVILLDEFQRVKVLPVKARDAVLSCLRSLFSNSPAFLSVVLAVGSRIEKSAMALLPPELKTLLGRRPSISLPEMDRKEAFEFVVERFAYFRPVGYPGSNTAPFTSDALWNVIDYLAAKNEASLIPRVILQALGWIYDEATFEHGNIQPSESLSQLEQLRWEG